MHYKDEFQRETGKLHFCSQEGSQLGTGEARFALFLKCKAFHTLASLQIKKIVLLLKCKAFFPL